MKHIWIIIAALIVVVGTPLNLLQAKTALLVTHYGSSDDSTRVMTIDRITKDIRDAFPNLEVRQAYISPIVRNKLAEKGILIDSPVEALLKLRVEGFDTVFVQSTTIIDGSEMAEVRKSAEEVAPFFRLLKVGNSLLHTPEDCFRLVDILSDYPCAKEEAVVYVGHGNNLPSTATYTQLDYMFTEKGNMNFHVSTIEGYPTVESLLSELSRDKKIRKITLIPLLLVCGNHTKKDLAGEFARELRRAGYNTDIVMRGLAEVPEVRAFYLEKVRKLAGLD